MINKILIDGIDRLGKSTLIQNIKDVLGYHDVIHCQKPEALSKYAFQAKETSLSTQEILELREIHKSHYKEKSSFTHKNKDIEINPRKMQQLQYQIATFKNMFSLLKSDAKIIWDRTHLGEMVYADIYRGYSGEYVLELEKNANIKELEDIRLILLIEDFEYSNHFVDDNLSLGPIENRKLEQEKFRHAFSKSCLPKKEICVTDKNTGKFKSQMQILVEAISD